MEVIYFLFNEGYAAHEGEELIRTDMCAEALRLGRLMAASSIAVPRVHALVAVMAFQAARLNARTDDAGELVLLEDQDRGRWDERLIALGFHHFDRSMAGDKVSEYHVQAAIAATHSRAEPGHPVHWEIVLDLYDQLFAMNGSPVVALNRAVAIAKVYSEEDALAEIERLRSDPKLENHYLLQAVRGHLLLGAGRRMEASECFQAASRCRCSEPERRFLKRKLAECRF